MIKLKNLMLVLVLALFSIFACDWLEKGEQTPTPRLSMFIGVDISGSFINSEYFDDSLDFLAHYLYCHLNGLDKCEVPNVLFVGSIGGAREGEAKTFYPIQMFANKSVEEIHAKLKEIFPKDVINPFTDYNAFFEQIALTVRNRNLLLRPISVVMVSDGKPDVKSQGKNNFESIDLDPLENLARSVTIRLLYTDAVTSKKWQTQVPRRRVKIWTQDAKVMVSWKDSSLFTEDQPLEEQQRFFEWINDNVDFGVRARRVR
ncbi:hypothetical protein GF407_04700 [candidate division KSB1 bacterium]|nr:hypothetical protein [candidate division KSB1 bacterium]